MLTSLEAAEGLPAPVCFGVHVAEIVSLAPLNGNISKMMCEIP